MLYSTYDVWFYTKRSAKCPVKEYLFTLDKKERTKINGYIEELRINKGILLAEYAKHIDDKIWELRIRFNKRHHRIFYFITSDRKIVFLSAFQKKSKKTPSSEIQKAYKYYFDYLSRI